MEVIIENHNWSNFREQKTTHVQLLHMQCILYRRLKKKIEEIKIDSKTQRTRVHPWNYNSMVTWTISTQWDTSWQASVEYRLKTFLKAPYLDEEL